jgi:hypothetical protein
MRTIDCGGVRASDSNAIVIDGTVVAIDCTGGWMPIDRGADAVDGHADLLSAGASALLRFLDFLTLSSSGT